MRFAPTPPPADASRPLHVVCLALVVAAVTIVPLDAAPPRRARPPKFGKSIEDAFFNDAREKLVGPRPASPGAKATPRTVPAASSQRVTPASGWSQWITAEALEDEIKSQQIKLAQTVRNPSQFKGGDYRQARNQLSVLAVMFGIVSEFDGRVRWQREAAAARDILARAGFNCKVGTDATYQEASALSDDLQLLVRGGSPELPTPAPDVMWSEVADRTPLMQRLEDAIGQHIDPPTANARQFERAAEGLAQEAELVAAIAEVISRDGFEFADDDTYLEYARAMKSHALSLREAARQNDYERARRAAGELKQTCTDCHDGYRG